MNIRRMLSRDACLVLPVVALCLFYLYQHFRIQGMLDEDWYELPINNLNEDDLEVDTPDYDSGHGIYPLLFQSNVEVEFPTVKGGNSRIPHILHQIYRNKTVPSSYMNNMRSFVKVNPTWEYRFWTFQSGRKLIVKHYPYLLRSYDSFNRSTDRAKKADMLKYAVLHTFGGLYAELDVENSRPLDIATTKYSCIIPVEPFEHSVFLNEFDVILNTAVMLCRPEHPFFKQVLLNLTKVANLENSVFDITGAGHLTRNYLWYNNLTDKDLLKKKTDDSSNSPYFYKGARAEDNNDAIYIPNSQYFMSNVNHAILNKNGEIDICTKPDTLVPFLTKRACAEFASRKRLRRRMEFLFTYRYWLDIWHPNPSYISKLVHIKKIIPRCVLY